MGTPFHLEFVTIVEFVDALGKDIYKAFFNVELICFPWVTEA